MGQKRKRKVIDSPTIERLSLQNAPIRDWWATDCTLLDLAVSGRIDGGFPGGRITHIYGAKSTGKTVLGQEPLGSVQRQGGIAVYADVEGTLDFDRAEDVFGLQIWSEDTRELPVEEREFADNFIYCRPVTIEQFFDEIIAGLIKDKQDEVIPQDTPICIVLDSLSAVTSSAELESKMVDSTYGTSRAKQMSGGMRRYIHGLIDNDISLIIIDQIRQNIGVSFGRQTTTSGGLAVGFYASCEVYLTKKTDIKNEYKETVGVQFDFLIDKNKVSLPKSSGSFFLYFDYGIDDVESNVEWLIGTKQELELFEQRGSWFTIKGDKLQSKDALMQYIEDNDLEEELRQEVFRVWQIVHADKRGRKKKVRVR